MTVTEVLSEGVVLLRVEKHQMEAEAELETSKNQNLPHPDPTTRTVRNRKHSLKVMKIHFL